MPEVGLTASLGLEKELELVLSALEVLKTLFYLAKVKRCNYNFPCFLWSCKC